MKTKSKVSGHIIRAGAWAVFLSVAFIAASWAFNSPNKLYKSAVATVGYGSMAKSPSQPRAFSFADRVAFQRAIEDVYWRHRIWPKENPDPKPSLDAVMSQAQLQKKVEGYLRDSLMLQDYWQRPITAQQLQAEMDRMARDTKQSEVLRELFEALGNDSAVIAECLARPILAERLIADFSAQAQTRHVESPQTDALRAMSVATTLGQVVYTLPEIANPGDSPCTDDTWTATTTANAPTDRSQHTGVWTGSEMIVWGGYNGRYLNTGGRYNPSTDTWTATSTRNAPSRRSNHIAVWTGSEMIVWGRAGNTGGRYNPSTDSWIDTSTTNAPADRFYETAVWTGSEMIVWGGYNYTTDFNTGGRYYPTTDIWTATSTTNAPAARYSHTAVWTGSEMIVWGGTSTTTYFNTGGRYCAQPQPPLTIIEPNGGEVWLMGSVQEIKWDANLKDSDRLIIAYSRDGGVTWFRIAQDVPALSLSYSWQVDNYPTTQGRVKIVLQGNRSITDQSDANFTVQPQPPPPYITLLRPNGGEVFPIGQYKNIHWNRRNPGGNTVDIDYSTDNGTTWIRIATQAQDTGWYLWNVPGPATTTAKVRIRYHETPTVNDASDAVFTIVSP